MTLWAGLIDCIILQGPIPLESGLIRGVASLDGNDLRPKLQNCLFPAPDRPLENVVTRNIFWVICNFFFSFSVTGNRDRKFRYCSRFYVRNWFTLLNEQNPLLDFEGTRFVKEL